MMYDYKLHLAIRTPQACPWEQSEKRASKKLHFVVEYIDFYGIMYYSNTKPL